MSLLTAKQRQILAFIEEESKKKGTAPTFREIQHHFGFSSLGTVYSHIQTLKKKRILKEGKYSQIELMSMRQEIDATIPLPLVGEIMQKCPPKMWNESVSYLIPRAFVIDENAAYLFIAKGESFQSELIDDGDFLVVQAGILPQEGDVVFALSEGSVLIKSYFEESSYIRLESKIRTTSQFFKPNALLIQGVVTAVIRGY